ncbi:MAG: DegV family protein [Dehalococcoidia bacterium]
MIGTTAIVLDSACYLPAEVVERFGAIVVPLTVAVDGEELREFADISSGDFYARLAAGAKVATSQPPPGRFADAYATAAAGGAARIVSIHIGANVSGTLNSARLGAQLSEIPVHLIDTGQASFVEGLCAWEAMEALAAGASIEEAEAAAHRAAAAAGNVFIVRGTELLARGGRMASPAEASSGVPVLAMIEGAVRPVGSAATVGEALDAIVAHVGAAVEANPGKRFRVGISNGAADELAALLEGRVRELLPTAEVMQYVIGPVVGAHTGPGCTGAVFLPRPV